MNTHGYLTSMGLTGLPLFAAGDSIAAAICAALDAAGETLQPGDVCVIAQKIVSKVEDRAISLADLKPGDAAIELAAKTGREPRHGPGDPL